MDYFNDVLTTFLSLERGSCVQGLMGLERHEGEKLITEFSFLGEISL